MESAQRGHHSGLHGRGIGSRVRNGFRKQEFWSGPQRGHTFFDDVRSAGSYGMRREEHVECEVVSHWPGDHPAPGVASVLPFFPDTHPLTFEVEFAIPVGRPPTAWF